jgi:hypothetical protein
MRRFARYRRAAAVADIATMSAAVTLRAHHARTRDAFAVISPPNRAFVPIRSMTRIEHSRFDRRGA